MTTCIKCREDYEGEHLCLEEMTLDELFAEEVRNMRVRRAWFGSEDMGRCTLAGLPDLELDDDGDIKVIDGAEALRDAMERHLKSKDEK